MKQTPVILAVLIFIITLSFGCQKPDSGPTGTASPSPQLSPTPDNQPRSGDLVDATASGEIDYRLTGIDSTSMTLNVRNKSERTWEVKVGIGTKLEPGSDVQRMVVTKELEIEVEPHTEETLEIEVSCLDITKEAPSESDKSWQISKSESLARFIKCANNNIDSTESEAERANVIQFSIWEARGATHDESIHFWTDNGLSTDDAEQRISEYESRVVRVTSQCGSLASI